MKERNKKKNEKKEREKEKKKRSSTIEKCGEWLCCKV